ncbi:hypothetical protein ACQP2F_33240 [Actinoplanes sp. CA-030573]|uniref:hypothetical protein n=1 Tax=Actinoplanes sp. CA-030573 TaxID=3239898 RepID=UPI003D8A11D0
MADHQPETAAHQHSAAAGKTAATAVPGADQVFLWIGDGTIAVRCHVHPDFNAVREYGPDREVPVAWIVSLLPDHLAQHAAEATDEPTNEEPVAPAVTAFPLDAFGQEVVRRCRWAIHYSTGDPYIKWPELYQVAVALVLGNHLHLQDVGPGYTPASATALVVRSIEKPPADIGVWIKAVRAETQKPGEMWSP